jgi:carotenoid cleavage dioxygenase
MTSIWFQSETHNPYLVGNFAPVAQEVTAYNLPVDGKIPPELCGRFVRNGANPIAPDPQSYHEMGGEGMVHGVCLRDSKALWYRNRWVRGKDVLEALNEPDIGGPPDLAYFPVNIGVMSLAGKTWALAEGGPYPIELTYELDSVCRNNLFGTLPGAFTAHPKLDPLTGELHAICYCWEVWNSIQYVVVGQDGRVRKIEKITLPGMSAIHDLGLTQRYVVILDLPLLYYPELSKAGDPNLCRWDNSYTARLGLLPREGTAADIHWFEIEPCFVFHPVNTFDTPGGEVVIDVCRYERLFDHNPYESLWNSGGTTLERWVLNPITGKVSEHQIDDRSQEFPRINPNHSSLPYRYGYTVLMNETGYGGTIKHDLGAETSILHDYGVGTASSEPVFVPRQNAASEDDGWVLSFVYDRDHNTSSLVILDALDFAGEPVATVHLPQRVPFGFHGDWLPDFV